MVDQAITIAPTNPPALRALGRVLLDGPAKLTGPKGESAELPAELYAVLKEMVASLSDGRSLVLMQGGNQLTISQAGEILGFARSTVLKMLKRGDLPCSGSGRHRRIALRDLMAYLKRRREALDRITREAYESGMYDADWIPEGGRE